MSLKSLQSKQKSDPRKYIQYILKTIYIYRGRGAQNKKIFSIHLENYICAYRENNKKLDRYV